MSEYNIYSSPTFRLIRNRPSFWEGFSSIIDFRDIVTHYDTSDTEIEADTRAITSDWDAIGMDMMNVKNSNASLQLTDGNR